jgi:putative endonuclease
VFKLIKTKSDHLLKGKNAEDLAHNYLLMHGLTLVCRNYRCKQGELDLIMKDKDFLVIVEVRYRNSNRYGSALESVTCIKQQRIIAASQHYLINQRFHGTVRFDVVAISNDQSIDWIKNAFTA